MHTVLPERKIRPRTAAVALAGDNGRVIRPADAGDFPFLRAMLFEAAHWRAGTPRPATEETFAHPALARYVEGWGRAGDAGVVAGEGGRRVGAAWYRLFSADRPGYGFVDARTPELSVGVLAHARGRGVGTALVHALLEQARGAGFEAISLSVEPDNPAVRLYERAGFTRVGGTGAWTMLVEL
jgi:GNAT superfamily N-acetyltransferase